ncbi:MAG: hypothetical protein LUD69_01650 [Oscillospiraceae bacterium]|nr:hypothetical protein [Oscillospiraceae bacterium]
MDIIINLDNAQEIEFDDLESFVRQGGWNTFGYNNGANLVPVEDGYTYIGETGQRTSRNPEIVQSYTALKVKPPLQRILCKKSEQGEDIPIERCMLKFSNDREETGHPSELFFHNTEMILFLPGVPESKPLRTPYKDGSEDDKLFIFCTDCDLIYTIWLWRS